MTTLIVILLVLLLLLCLWLLLLRCRKGNPMWAVLDRFRYTHRGLYDPQQGIPENSLSAFRRAADHGFGTELDVHLTKDGRLAVIHDCSLLRMAGADVKVTDLTAEELRTYRLQETEEPIPFLEEVLPLFEGKAPIIVEVKVDGGNAAALCEATCSMLDQHHVDYCMESFHPQAVLWLKKHRPEICRGQLTQDFLHEEHTKMGALADFAMTHCLTCFLTTPDFIAYKHTDRNRLALKVCRRIWGVREVSWTIQTPEELAACEADHRLPIFEQFIPD